MEDAAAQDQQTRATTVGAALDSVGREPVIVAGDASIPAIAVAAAARPDVHVICVVDAAGKLAGLIRLDALCDDLFFHVVPEEFLPDIFDPEKLGEFGRYSRARTAVDLMEDPESVRAEDGVVVAFRRMHERGLEGLPVLDGDGRPVAYIDRLRLLSVWVTTHPRASGPT